MRNNSTVVKNGNKIFKQPALTIGLDLGDRTSCYCILDELGNVILERSVPTTSNGIRQAFGKMPRCRIALETGTHSPWVSRQLARMDHEVIVAHARNVRLIGESSRKDDRLDARTLARLARIDPGLLGPVRHRSAQAQIQLTVIRARAALVSTRTALVNAARVDQIVWPAAAEMRHGANESRQLRRVEPGIAGCVGSSVARDRIVE
jgi:hypothetical protein